MELAIENEENGYNLYQLVQAMGRFLPLLPPVPNLGSLTSRKTGHRQLRDQIRQGYVQQVHTFFNEFVAEQVEMNAAEKARIWQEAETGLTTAFDQFPVDGLSVNNAALRQQRFKQNADAALRKLLLDTLAALDAEQLQVALQEYVRQQQQKWRKAIGDAEYRNFQRLLLLDSIDREWRDYLTAADDLRREIGLEAVGQRDPKVQYKIRSAEMFQHMRSNVEKNIVERFFQHVAQHQQFIRQQEQEVAYQTQAREAGYAVVKRDNGKGAELRRDVPKVGRNDLCPCGSGKKYKHCHMLQDNKKSAAAVVDKPDDGRKSGKKQRS
jgi:preprotein translocase subunit SecA